MGYLCRSFGSVLRTTVQHYIVPQEIRGKINSTIYLLTWGTIPVSGYFASFILNFIDLYSLYFIASLVFVIVNALLLIPMKNKEISNLLSKL